MSARPITNSEDVLDSRDIMERIAFLRYLASGGESSLDDDETAELAALEALAEEASDLTDWEYGVGLIRDSYFTEYAQETAEDIGAINSDAGWPLYCIDWERAARDLQMDYSAVDFDGVTYWIRN